MFKFVFVVELLDTVGDWSG